MTRIIEGKRNEMLDVVELMWLFLLKQKKMHTVDEQEKQGYRFHNKNFINFQVLVFSGSLHYFPLLRYWAVSWGHRNVLWGH